MPDKYRVAVIGLGRIGFQLEKDPLRQKPCTHLGAWLAHKERCEVVAVSDIAPLSIRGPSFETLKEKVGFNYYEDYEDLMNRAKPDIVSIATPDDTHVKIARVVMRYEPLKLVFLEKPIAKTLAEADLIIETAREFKVKLAINHTRRWDPMWREAAKQCVGEQPVRMICHSSGSKIRDGVHMADLINWFNPKLWYFSNPKREDGEVDYLLFEVDLLFKDRRLRITDNGYASKMYTSENSQRFEGFKELALSCQVVRSLYPKSPMFLATEQLLDCLDVEGGRKTGVFDPFCTGEQGKRALELALKW